MGRGCNQQRSGDGGSVGGDGGGCKFPKSQLLPFPPTTAFVFSMPMLLLTLDGAISRVPTTVVHRLRSEEGRN